MTANENQSIQLGSPVYHLDGTGFVDQVTGREVLVASAGRSDKAVEVVVEQKLANSLQTAFEDTVQLNTLAGHVSNGGWAAVEHQMKIVQEEWREMTEDGIGKFDVQEFRDGLADLVFTLFGLAYRADIPLADDVAAVVASNATKYDDSEEDAFKTQAKYEALGVLTHFVHRTKEAYGEDKWVTYSSVEQSDINGKHYFKGKWLKSYRFQLPKFKPLIGSELMDISVKA